MTAPADRQAIVRAAMAVAKDAAEGRLEAAEFAATVAQEARELFGRVEGTDDPLWPVQVDVARQVLALDGIPADELAEWLAVTRAKVAAAAPPAVREPSWIERVLAAADDLDPLAGDE